MEEETIMEKFKYRRKKVVEAVQVTEDNIPEIVQWVNEEGHGKVYAEDRGNQVLLAYDYDLETARVGDYILMEESGNTYRRSESYFNHTFERMEDLRLRGTEEEEKP